MHLVLLSFHCTFPFSSAKRENFPHQPISSVLCRSFDYVDSKLWPSRVISLNLHELLCCVCQSGLLFFHANYYITPPGGLTQRRTDQEDNPPHREEQSFSFLTGSVCLFGLFVHTSPRWPSCHVFCVLVLSSHFRICRSLKLAISL